MVEMRIWPIRALVVDEHGGTRAALRARLKDIGIVDIWEADDSRTALAMLRDFNCGDPDLVICNLETAQAESLNFCTSVRKDKHLSCRDVPIVLLNGRDDEGLTKAARKVGATEVLNKRVTNRVLTLQLQEIAGICASA